VPRAAPCGVSSAAAAAASPRRLHHTYSRPLPRPTACERTHKHAHTHTHTHTLAAAELANSTITRHGGCQRACSGADRGRRPLALTQRANVDGSIGACSSRCDQPIHLPCSAKRPLRAKPSRAPCAVGEKGSRAEGKARCDGMGWALRRAPRPSAARSSFTRCRNNSKIRARMCG
jgi:hypothetical protein